MKIDIQDFCYGKTDSSLFFISSGSSAKFYPAVPSANDGEGGISALASPILSQKFMKSDNGLISFEQSQMEASSVEDNNYMNCNATSLTNGLLSAGRSIAKEQSSSSVLTSEASNTSSNRSDLSMNIIDEGPANESLDFEPFFQEGYCKASSLDECHKSTEDTNVDSNDSPPDAEKSEEDGDSDDMLGGVFAFSEEGTHMEASLEHFFLIPPLILLLQVILYAPHLFIHFISSFR